MSKYPLRPLGDAAALDIDEVPIDPDKSYPIAGVYGFGRGLFHREPILGSQTSYKKLYRLHVGHIVMSRLKAFEGAISCIPVQFSGSFLSSEFPTFEIKEEVADIRYVSHICGWPEFWSLLQKGSKGIGARRERVSAEMLLSIKVPLPDLDEQARVATRLDTLLLKVGAVDGFTGNVDFSRLKYLAVSGLGSVLAKWQDGTVRIDKLCSTSNDLVRPGEDPGSAKEFVGLEHIAPHVGACIGSRPIGDEKGRKFRFAPGDVVYGYLRPYLNKVWVADRHGLCSVEQYVLRPNGRMPAELIAAGLRSREALDKVLSLTNNLQLPRLRSGLLMSLEIPDIPECNHESASSDVASFMYQIRRYGALQRGRSELLINLRPSILNAAFMGRL